MDEKVNSITKGLTQNEVYKIMGAPHKINKSQLIKRPFWGPREGLEDKLFTHMKYIEYKYLFKDDEFYIWFSGESESEDHKWIVVSKRQYPVDAVYESTNIEPQD